jgi:hypothetical protein
MTKAEQEIVISKCADQTHWTIYSTDPYWTRFFRALGQKVGGREYNTRVAPSLSCLQVSCGSQRRDGYTLA